MGDAALAYSNQIMVQLADGSQEIVVVDPEFGPLGLDGSCHREEGSQTNGWTNDNVARPWRELSSTAKKVLIHTVAKKNRSEREMTPDFWSAANNFLGESPKVVETF